MNFVSLAAGPTWTTMAQVQEEEVPQGQLTKEDLKTDGADLREDSPPSTQGSEEFEDAQDSIQAEPVAEIKDPPSPNDTTCVTSEGVTTETVKDPPSPNDTTCVTSEGVTTETVKDPPSPNDTTCVTSEGVTTETVKDLPSPNDTTCVTSESVTTETVKDPPSPNDTTCVTSEGVTTETVTVETEPVTVETVPVTVETEEGPPNASPDELSVVELSTDDEEHVVPRR